MLTAHLPAGYCLSHAFPRRSRAVVAACLIGSILPDFDMLFFHFVDNKAFHHHKYWVHIPLFWALIAVVTLPLAIRLKRREMALAFFAAIFLHLLLDSIGGGIMWLAPVDDTLYALVTVQPTHSHWVWSFVFHWTFLAEVAIWLAAIALWWNERRGRISPGVTPEPG
jgi:hypothetical protein